MSEQRVRTQRSDARRNRAQVLQVAADAFASEGLGVPVHEIARRAGVGTGTVSRHFPTKESLFVAILQQRMEELTAEADRLAAQEPPGSALFAYFQTLLREGAGNRAISDALAGAGFDLETAENAPEHDVSGRLRTMLSAAQEAGEVRVDVNWLDLKVLMNACLARSDDPEALDRMVSVVIAGLGPYDHGYARRAPVEADRGVAEGVRDADRPAAAPARPGSAPGPGP
jgi:AcrR family transcriptional regulator